MDACAAARGLPGWGWNADDAAWEGSEPAVRFVEKEGHSRVPYVYRDDEGYQLGAWVGHQRGFRRRGKLSRERAQRLEATPGWVWKVE